MARFFSLSLFAAFGFAALTASALAQEEAPPLVQLLGRWELANGECSEAYTFAMHGDDVAWGSVFHGDERTNDLHVTVNGDRIVASNNQHSFAPHGDTLRVFFNNQPVCTFRRPGTAQTEAAAPAPAEPEATPEQTPVVQPSTSEPEPLPPSVEPSLPTATQVSALDQLVGRWEWEGGQCSQTYVFELEGDALRWTTINRGRGYPVQPPFTIDGERIVLDDGHTFAPRGDQLFVLMNGRPVCMFRRAA